MRDVAAAAALVEAAVVGVEVAAGVAKFSGRGRVVEELRKRVVRQQPQTVAEPPVELDESAVVAGIAHRRVDDGDVAELRKWTQQLRITGADPLRWNLVDGQIGSG